MHIANFTITNVMDIVSRLKKFMEEEHIASTQFADKCGIPRPTVSQLLNGRNKKVSDELIGKIHAAFPQLSVLWLMFGEGNMKSAPNFEISEAQNGQEIAFSDQKVPEQEIFSSEKIDFNPVSKNSSDNFSDLFGTKIGEDEPIADLNLQPKDAGAKSVVKKIAEGSDSYKKITSIVVFYDDSTFQTFNPSAL